MVNWQDIDEKWQEAWREAKLFEPTPDKRSKFYLTVAYPYVSGPMHIGHGRTYTVPDVIARYKRMKGFNVLFPMAYHFTGTPIVGAAKRVVSRDPKFVEVLTKRYKIDEGTLKEMENPNFYANYWARESDLSYRRGMEWLGFSIDWRREFTTVDHHYNKFITWQYHKLWDAGLIVKGKHPVRWCPNCGNPVTDHDLLDGEGVEIVEFTLLKYRLGDLVLPAATLRPETVFGVTNLWLNPEAAYVVADVGGEKWIVSEQAVEKLKQQGYSVGETKPYKIDFTKEAEVPLTHKLVPILPAKFVDPKNATGVVGSVPSHAPYDYVALLELQQRPEALASHGVDPKAVEGLKPISLIEVEGYGESPAVDVVARMKIKSQRDRKLEEATAEVYKNEFAKGRMRDWVPKFSGMPVSEAKDAVRDEMLGKNEAAKMYEFAALPVTCRCNTPIMIKIVEDQWFLNYSDEGWKKKTRAWLTRMHLVPPETRVQFEHTIEWLREWPCTRKIGMGTPAPWDPNWIIESLSDSTIYMAYYTISHIFKTIDPDLLNDSVFDYIFHGKGDVGSISSSTGIDRKKLEGMRLEYEYWYPLDYRMSAYELIHNHLTFHVFHHVQLLPDRCPRGIVNFGMVFMEGEKMSSSKGNLVAIGDAVEEHGADTVRAYLMSAAEPWQDLDWKSSEVAAMQRNLERFCSLAEEIISLPGEGTRIMDQPERWLHSRLQKHVEAATTALDAFETRTAFQHAFFMMMQDVRRYMKRAENPEARTYMLKKVLEAWLRLLSPFTPHLCEELWSKMGKKGFVSVEKWPVVEPHAVDEASEFLEDYIGWLTEDANKIKKVLKTKPDRAFIYVAQDWKWIAYLMTIDFIMSGKKEFGKLIKDVEKYQKLRLYKNEMPNLLQKMAAEIKAMPVEELNKIKNVNIDEFAALEEASSFIGEQLGLKGVKVFRADDPAKYDPDNRAISSLPLRPAIYLE
ncbi:MAG: leucine--tRNA ligase [Candidatus Hadarchaeota archaeon]